MRAEKQAVIQKQRKRRATMRRTATFGAVAAAIILIVVLIQVSGGHSKKTAAKSTTSTTTTTFPPPSTLPLSTAAVAPVCPPANETKRVVWFTKAPPDCIGKRSVWDATFDTSVGTFVVKMDAAASYAGVNNFVFLAGWNYYNGTFFHRIVTDFVVQGGDPTGTGSGGPHLFPGYSFTGNLPPKSCAAKSDCYATGDFVYANSNGPSTDGSQFFAILPGGAAKLSPDYTLFGKVISGQSVVDKIGTFGIASETGTPKLKVYVLKVTLKKVKA
jgi:cyclophilin family peptidyl-prolyl cis-trans isomerase